MDRERLARIDEELGSLGKSESEIELVLGRFEEHGALVLGDIDRELGELGNGRAVLPEAPVATFARPEVEAVEPPPAAPPPAAVPLPDDIHQDEAEALEEAAVEGAIAAAGLHEETHEELPAAVQKTDERPPLELLSEDGPTIESEPPPRVRSFGRIPAEALDSDLPPAEQPAVAALEERHPPLYDSEPPPAGEPRMGSEPPTSARPKPPPRRRSESPPAWALSTNDLFTDGEPPVDALTDDISDLFAPPPVPRIEGPPTGNLVSIADDEDYMEEGRTSLFGEEEIAAIRSGAPPGDRSEADRELDALLAGVDVDAGARGGLAAGYADHGRDSVEFEVMVDDMAIAEVDDDDPAADFAGPTVPEADGAAPAGQPSEAPADEEEGAKKKPSFFKKLFG